MIRNTHVDMARAGFKDFSAYFDRVLVDAPCTGLGVLARNPDSRWKRKVKGHYAHGSPAEKNP